IISCEWRGERGDGDACREAGTRDTEAAASGGHNSRKGTAREADYSPARPCPPLARGNASPHGGVCPGTEGGVCCRCQRRRGSRCTFPICPSQPTRGFLTRFDTNSLTPSAVPPYRAAWTERTYRDLA